MATKKNPLNNSAKLDEFDLKNFIKKDFKASIEKEFFCEFDVKFSNETSDAFDLILELNFNFDLEQGLPLLAQKNIGSLDLEQSTDYLFLNQLSQLIAKASKTIDIEELNIVFTDCNLVIHRIYPQSLIFHIEELVQKIDFNKLYFTKGFSVIPYEIHIPVLEEKPFNLNINATAFKPKQINSSDYLQFWALYFEHSIEAVIYDVSKKDTFDSELVMVK